MNFLIKKFSSIILTISFLLLIYTFYKSEIFWDGGKRNYFKTYYSISLILICFSIITFFINNKIKQYLIISVISMTISLYLFEGYLIFKGQLSKEQIYEKQTGNKWDRRYRLDIYKELQKNNNKITVSVSPGSLIGKNYLTLQPLSGLSNSRTIHCNENGNYSIYLSDRYGFNNPDNEWDKKEIEYFLVGDSFTHGACVNRPNDISSVLRNLSNKSVLNLGMGGNGPLIEYATIREYLNEYAKKVLWIYYEGNDGINLESEKKNNILINYLKDLNFTQNLKVKQNEIDNLLIKIIKEEEERELEKEKKDREEGERERQTFKFLKFIKIYNIRNLIILPPAPAPLPIPAPEFKKILQLTKETANKNNSELYFVYLPKYNRYKKSFDNTNYHLTKIKNIVTELKIPFIDIHKEVFEKEQNPLKLFPFEKNGHYNDEGYKKVAEIIYKLTKD